MSFLEEDRSLAILLASSVSGPISSCSSDSVVVIMMVFVWGIG